MERLSRAVLPPEGDPAAEAAALAAFVRGALVEAGLARGRGSGGLTQHRVVEDGPSRARICGELWATDRTPHVFWLDLVALDEAAIAWVLLYDLVAPRRRLREAVRVLEQPEGHTWRARLSGRIRPSGSAGAG